MSFKLDLANFSNKLINESPTTIKQIGDDMLLSIESLTPIDTGRARDGWESVFNDQYTTIWNDVPYIVYLEEGSSTQAPNGMVKVTIAKIINDIDRGKYKI